MTTFRQILVPIDFGEPSEMAVDLALAIAERFVAPVTLLHVTYMPPYYYSAYAEGLAFPLDEMETRAKAALDEAVAKAKARHPLTKGMLVAGPPLEQILAAAQTSGADLIVMGTHGRRGVSRALLGSVAERVVRYSPIPVMTTGARHAEPK
jgi:nucleotide-binding universal stress UspA family protein